MSEVNNPLGLVGIEFTEYASPDADYMHKVFSDFGFSRVFLTFLIQSRSKNFQRFQKSHSERRAMSLQRATANQRKSSLFYQK